MMFETQEVKHDSEYFARYRWLGSIQAGCRFCRWTLTYTFVQQSIYLKLGMADRMRIEKQI